MSHQVALTIRAAIKRGRVDALGQVLSSMAADSAHNRVLPFGDLPDTHFGRLLIVDDGPDRPTLLLMLDCDAPLEQRLDDLVRVAGKGLDELYCHCEDYPQDGDLTAEGRLRYLRSRMTAVDVFYVHAVGRTLQQIRQEELLRRAIEDFLDRPEWDRTGLDGLQIRASIRDFVRGQPTLAWALSPPPPLELSFRLREALHKYGVPLLLFFNLGALIPAVVVWAIALRLHELTDPPPSLTLDPVRLRELGDQEDFIEQNAISTLAPIKPGPFWRLTATIFLGIANYSARHIFNSGSLAGLTTVQFARFLRLDSGRQVLFTSYYDGSLESYMNDFIEQVGWVLNAVFGNEDGYPTTRWLFFNGAANEIGFKTFLRGRQIPTQVWYSAYPDLAAANIDNNAQIRSGLRGDMTAAEAEAWLRRL